ncbi:MAG: hypothetical protein EBT15_12010 [Betaproteobacteria bacterium]|nr:hypothetical protein [Betaproteobacteria bacterium]
MPSQRKRYATISWCAVDVQEFRPNWSVQRCNQFLDDNEDRIQVAMIEAGNDAIKECLPADDEEGE